MSKGLKIGLGIGLIILIVVVLYYLFFKGSTVKWTEFPKQDIAGSDISNESGVSLEKAKAQAILKGAKAFVYFPDEQRAWYKSSAGPVIAGWQPAGVNYTTYIKG